MGRPKFETFMRYRLFRNWWSRRLKQRPCKLIDYNTGKTLAHEKRVFRERPKLDDLLNFFIDCKIFDFDISFDKVEENFRCELYRPDIALRIVARGPTATISVEQAAIEFLKKEV